MVDGYDGDVAAIVVPVAVNGVLPLLKVKKFMCKKKKALNVA